MIDCIFIPTVKRSNNQITYNNLPEKLRTKVVMIVQDWEKDEYESYPCEVIVLPSHINLNNYYAIAETRKFIYELGKDLKYAVLDDDIIFGRRNAKYWTGDSNMEKSKRICTEDDVLEMFELFDSWLDDPDVSICGCGHAENPPQGKNYSSNASLSSVYWINGPNFKEELDSMKLTEVGVAEDAVFLLSLLTRGYGNRVSQEFIFNNQSVHKKGIESVIWDNQKAEDTLRDHEIVEKMFPGFFNVVREDGKRKEGGFRNQGKVKIFWSKAFKSSQVSKLDEFIS